MMKSDIIVSIDGGPSEGLFGYCLGVVWILVGSFLDIDWGFLDIDRGCCGC